MLSRGLVTIGRAVKTDAVTPSGEDGAKPGTVRRMTSMRVWLSRWEWACCGEPFAVGDRITLDVRRRPGGWIAELLGPELALGVDAEEEHHENPGPERLTGTVTAIHGVTIDHTERRELRTPPRSAPEPHPLGDGVFAIIGSRDPWVTVAEPIPGTARLYPAPHVPWPSRGDDATDEPPAPRGLSGYLVDLDAE